MRSLEGLTETFRLLETTINAHGFNPELVGQLEASIKACKDGVEKLQKKLEKFKGEGDPVSLQGKARSMSRKMLYPFRQSTLVRLGEIISELRDNVGLAMNTLHM